MRLRTLIISTLLVSGVGPVGCDHPAPAPVPDAGSDPVPDAGSGPVPDAGSGPVEPTPTDCSQETHVVYFRYADEQLAVRSGDATVLLNRLGQPIGVMGTSQNGDSFMLVRDGDNGDGALSPGIHDVSKYPYHLFLALWPASSGDSCEHSPSCRWYFAVGGEWNISSGSPFQGSFHVSALTREENCWEEGTPVDTSACSLLPGELTGCFRVPLSGP